MEEKKNFAFLKDKVISFTAAIEKRKKDFIDLIEN